MSSDDATNLFPQEAVAALLVLSSSAPLPAWMPDPWMAAAGDPPSRGDRPGCPARRSRPAVVADGRRLGVARGRRLDRDLCRGRARGGGRPGAAAPSPGWAAVRSTIMASRPGIRSCAALWPCGDACRQDDGQRTAALALWRHGRAGSCRCDAPLAQAPSASRLSPTQAGPFFGPCRWWSAPSSMRRPSHPGLALCISPAPSPALMNVRVFSSGGCNDHQLPCGGTR
jgi:hypothetical protein